LNHQSYSKDSLNSKVSDSPCWINRNICFESFIEPQNSVKTIRIASAISVENTRIYHLKCSCFDRAFVNGSLFCYKRRVRNLIAAILLTLFVYDVAIDSFDADCQTQVTVCHHCSCGSHATEPQNSTMAASVLSFHRVSNGEVFFVQSLFDKSVFHPPKISA
jgi:hypothetical protein